MSILNGNVSREVIRPEPAPFGESLAAVRILSATGVMDVCALDEDHLLAAEDGALSIWTVTDEGEKLTARYSGIGSSRQLSYSKGFAYVTARACGIYVIDLRVSCKPVLAAHLDSLELATGVCSADGLLAVTNRHMGTELWDVRDPYHPVFMSDFRCGEAQSVWLFGKTALIGDWMNKRVQVFDISDPFHPTCVARYNVDGFADGVCAVPYADGMLGLCATGHHAARMKNRLKYVGHEFVVPEMFSDGYGCGHGIELFDITTPRDPEYLATLKTPPHFGGIDSWRVFGDGKTAYLTDSIGGLFAVDIRVPSAPSFLWHYRVRTDGRVSWERSPMIQSPAEPVMGVAVLHGRVYAALPRSGIHVLESSTASRPFVIPSASIDHLLVSGHECTQSYVCTQGQIHTFTFKGNFLYTAAGEQGIEVFDPDTGKLLHHFATRDICHDLLILNGFLLTAEGDSGVSCYSLEGDSIRELSRLSFPSGDCVRELVPVGSYIAAELGSSRVALLSLSPDGELSPVGSPASGGLLYFRHLSRTTAFGCLVANPLNDGPRLLRPSSSGLETIVKVPHSDCPIEEGACGDGTEGLFVIHARKYAFIRSPDDLARITDTDFSSVSGAALRGEPFFVNGRLILLERATGMIEVLDVSDRDRPVFLWSKQIDAAPEYVVEEGGELLVACGRKGILKLTEETAG